MVKGAPSLNPSGRPKGAAGLAKYIGEQTEDGRELVDRLLSIARGAGTPRMIEGAILALLDRYAGKPVQDTRTLIANVTTPALSAATWEALSPGERERFLDELERGAIDAAAVAALPSGDA